MSKRDAIPHISADTLVKESDSSFYRGRHPAFLSDHSKSQSKEERLAKSAGGMPRLSSGDWMQKRAEQDAQNSQAGRTRSYK